MLAKSRVFTSFPAVLPQLQSRIGLPEVHPLSATANSWHCDCRLPEFRQARTKAQFFLVGVTARHFKTRSRQNHFSRSGVSRSVLDEDLKGPAGRSGPRVQICCGAWRPRPALMTLLACTDCVAVWLCHGCGDFLPTSPMLPETIQRRPS